MNKLQSVIEFNQEILEDSAGEVFDTLQDGDDTEGVTEECYLMIL